MSRNVARQINRAMLPQKIEDLGNRAARAEFAINDVAAALINAGVLEVEPLQGGGARLVPAKKRAERSLLDRVLGR